MVCSGNGTERLHKCYGKQPFRMREGSYEILTSLSAERKNCCRENGRERGVSGGFYSPMQLALGKLNVGAGIYVTSKRLFIFQKGEDMDITFNKIATGSPRKDFVPANLTPEQNRAIIEQLSSKCPPQIHFRKNQISALEMKEPPGIFRTGHLNVLLTSGDTLKLIIGKKREYEYILNLLRSFSPQVVKKAD